MQITLISDTHQLVQRPAEKDLLTSRLTGGQVLIHAGDMSGMGSIPEITTFLEWFSGLPYTHKILIAGNHDWLFEKEPYLAKEILTDYPGITYLNDSGTEIDGIRFWGSPITPNFNNWAFNRYHTEIGKHWDLIPDGTDVLITHGPPYLVLDQVGGVLQNVGCPKLLKRVQEVRPKLHVFGHIHEGRGLKQIGETIYVNASVLNSAYRLYDHETIVVEI